MAYIDQAIAVLDNVSERTLTNAQIADIAKSYIVYDEAEALTNEEIATRFILTLRSDMKTKVRRGKQQIELRAVQQAINDSDNLLDPEVP